MRARVRTEASGQLNRGGFIRGDKKEDAPVSFSLAPCDCSFLTLSDERLQTSVLPHDGLVDARLTPAHTTSLSNTPLTSNEASRGKMTPVVDVHPRLEGGVVAGGALRRGHRDFRRVRDRIPAPKRRARLRARGGVTCAPCARSFGPRWGDRVKPNLAQTIQILSGPNAAP